MPRDLPLQDHPAILKPQQSYTDAGMPHGATVSSKPTEEPKKLIYRQYTCDPQGLAALCCELDSKGYEPVQVLPGYFGSGVNGPFHTPLGWTVLARRKPEPPPTPATESNERQDFSSSASRGKRK